MAHILRRSDDIKDEKIACGMMKKLADGKDLGTMDIARIRVGDTRAHFHRKSTEIYYVLKGSLEVQLDGKSVSMKTGDLLIIMPNTRHRAISMDNAEILAMCSPPWTENDEIYDKKEDSMKRPIEDFYSFHKELHVQLDKLEKSLNRFKVDGKADGMRLALDGFYMFVKNDLGVHVMEEEKALFPVMKSAKLLDSKLEALVDEHEAVAASVETLALLKDMKSLPFMEVQKGVQSIVDILRSHVTKEEMLVLEVAKKSLTEKQDSYLREMMDKARKKYGKGG